MELRSAQEARLPTLEMEALKSEVRSFARRLSRDQLLEVADLLHELIRARRQEGRSWLGDRP